MQRGVGDMAWGDGEGPSMNEWLRRREFGESLLETSNASAAALRSRSIIVST